jgi:hypothetical protein
MTLETNMELDNYEYLDKIDDRVNYISKYFRLTSPIEKGKLHNNVFYGENSKEIIISGESDWEVSDVIENWKDYAAVTVLRCPVDDLNLLLPKNQYDFYSDELSVFFIDIRLLALQYKLWSNKNTDMESGDQPGKFIGQIVLPNMVLSQTDYVLINRLRNLFLGLDNDTAPAKHPFPVVDYSNRLDRVLYTSLKRIKDKRMRYEEMLENIPAISDTDMEIALKIPRLPNTKQIRWAVFLSRLDIMDLLIDIGGEDALKINRHLINSLQINIKMLKRDNIFEGMLTDKLYDNLELKLLKLKNL